MICCVELSVSAIFDVVKKGSRCIMIPTILSWIRQGLPESGLSFRSKSFASNLSNHLLHVLSETASSPKTFANFYTLL